MATTDTTAIDVLTRDFYQTISFNTQPNYDATTIGAFFYGDGMLVNNGFKDPVVYTPASYVENMIAQVANGDITNFHQGEVSAATEIFGKIARRTSVYQYSFEDHLLPSPTRGVAYLQFIEVEGRWKIISMIYADENESRLVSEIYGI